MDDFIDPDEFVDPDTMNISGFVDPDKTSLWEDTKIGFNTAGNMVDTYVSGLAGAAASTVGDVAYKLGAKEFAGNRWDEADQIYREMEQRNQTRMEVANPENKEQGFGGKLISSVPGILTFPLSPADTGQTMIKSGETTDKAISGALYDTTGNVVGAAIPFGKGANTLLKTVPKSMAEKAIVQRAATGAIGAGVNVAQDAATRLAISAEADQQATKDIFKPTWETSGLAAVPGMVMGAAAKPNYRPRNTVDRLNNLKAIAEAEKAKQVDVAPIREPIAKVQNEQSPQRDLFIDEPTVKSELTTKEPTRQSESKGVVDNIRNFDNIADVTVPKDVNFSPENLSRLDYDGLDKAYTDAVNHNRNVSLEGIKAFFGEAQAKEASKWSNKKIDNWLLDNETVASSDWMQSRYINEDSIREYKDLVSDFDTKDARSLGSSIALKLKESDKPGFEFSPEGTAVRNALEYASKQGWEFSEVLSGMREKVTKYAGNDAPELFKRLFKEASKTIATVKEPGVKRLENNVQKDVNPIEIRKTDIGFEAYLDGKKVGYLKDNLLEGQAKQIGENANIDMVKVDDDVKGTGVGRALYEAFYNKHEGMVAPSGKTTPDAWKQWQRNYPEKVTDFVNQEALRIQEGASREMVLGNITDPTVRTRVAVAAGEKYIPKSQRGGLNFKEIADGFAKLLEPLRTRDVTQVSQEQVLNNVIQRKNAVDIPPDPLASSVVTKALEGPTGGANRFFSAGATLEALKRNSPLIKGVGEIVQNFGKRSEKWVRETIFPVEREFRKLSSIDLVEMNAIMKQELESDFRYSPDQLAQAGFNEKQIRSHQAMRELFDQTLKIQNEGRAAQGKEPITGIEAYHAARWDGDFGVELKNAAGEVVWKVRADTKMGAMRQAKALMKKVDGLTMGREFDRLNARGVETNDLQSAYTTMLDILGRDNPVVEQIKKIVDEENGAQTNAALANTQHFKQKTGVRGYVGDRPWVNPAKDAKQFFQQQIQYAKNASKWAEIQKAMPNLKEILSNEQLIARHPEQVKWAQEYVQNALGFGENKAVRMVENELGKLFGVSPKAVGDAIGGMKYVWITQKLMGSLGYNAVQVIQLANTTAWHSDLSAKGYSHNPVSTGIMGLIGGLQLGAVHTIDGVRGRLDTSKMAMLPDHMKAALEYAENNSVTNRSSYDETPIGQGNIVTRGISKTVSLVDTFTRGMAYMSYVQHLQESGRFTKETWGDMFKMAEDYTNASMGDARSTEKALIFSKAGNVGSAFNTLQTFNVNWFNQWSYFSRELARGNPRPFFMGLVVQGLVAGAAGLPFINDLDKAWEFVKANMMPTKMWNEVKDWSIKGQMLSMFGPDNLSAGETLTYGALSTATNIGFNSRLNAPSIIDAPQIPGGMLVDITRQLTSIASATASIDDPVKWSQAALDVTPPGLKEFVAQNLLEQYTQAKRPNGDTLPFARRDLAKREATTVRNPFDRKVANMGMKSQKEVVQNDLLWNMKQQEAVAKDRQKALLEKMYSDVSNGKDINDKVLLYREIGGNPDNLEELFQKQAKDEFMSRVERKQVDPKSTIKTMLMLKKLKDLEDERKAKQTATP